MSSLLSADAPPPGGGGGGGGGRSRRRANSAAMIPWITQIKAAPAGIDDMVLLPRPDEGGIVANLKERLKANVIYTYIGHVLVCVNPYRWLDIYDSPSMHYYVRKQRIDAPPHVFATAEAAYRTMVQEEDKQCVIISGESGAGKTEASKQIQNYIAEVSGSGGGAGVEKVKTVFLKSNPLLEAFGNAKTLRNNNSSRFGKYFELYFDRVGQPRGGLVTNYLLEKSRIVKPGKGERNFHIFYQLLSGAPGKVRKAFSLAGPDSFGLTCRSGCTTVDGVDDSTEFTETFNAMKAVTFKGKEIEATLKLVAIVLHMSNVSFQPQSIDGAEGCAVRDAAALDLVCSIAQVDRARLEHCLTYRQLQTMAPGGKIETYEVPMNPTQASASRDAIAKTIYSRLFDYLVQRVNDALVDAGDMTGVDDTYTIGVLDIYGFEIFKKNGFEQLCINYVNEKLQQIFIQLTLKAEQEEYKDEGIEWKPIPFFNNKVVCELIEAKRPSPGILPILDDTCKTMHARSGAEGLDAKFVENLCRNHGSHKHFQGSSKGFVIKHYAGPVDYSPDGFGDANRDALRPDLVLVLQSSQDRFLPALFPEVIDPDDKKSPPTAGSTIRSQCAKLVTALMDCTPHYVRCIKPNEQKAAGVVDDGMCRHQAQYLGLPENIKVRRAGYAYRAEYHRFLERYRILSPQTWPAPWTGEDKKGARAIVNAVARDLGLDKADVQFGRTKLFVRQPESFFALERLLEQRIGLLAASVQRAWRKFSSRRKFVVLQVKTAKLYAAQGKARCRASIYRPYLGDYLQSSDPQTPEIRKAVRKVLDYYDDEMGRIVFLDFVARLASPHDLEDAALAVAVSTDAAQGQLQWRRQLLVVTSSAIYLFEQSPAAANERDEALGAIPPPRSGGRRGGGRGSSRRGGSQRAAAAQGQGDAAVGDRVLPPLLLRRRLDISDVSGLALSRQADNYIVLRVRGDNVQPEGDRSFWARDNSAPRCQVSGVEFGMFKWRHHCRFTGQVCADEVCSFSVPLPDLGWYSPQRICDPVIGLPSVEPKEDLVLTTANKSELLAVLSDIKGSGLQVDFSDSINLNASPTVASVCPCESIRFSLNQSNKGAATEQFSPGPSNKGIVTVSVGPGVPESVVADRRKRADKRRKQRERRVAEEREMAQQRRAEREARIEAERQARVAEKKRKKAAERERRRGEEETAKPQAQPRVRKFGGGNSTANGGAAAEGGGGAAASGGGSSAQSELAAKLARRRASQE